jgi:hypothetical protein
MTKWSLESPTPKNSFSSWILYSLSKPTYPFVLSEARQKTTKKNRRTFNSTACVTEREYPTILIEIHPFKHSSAFAELHKPLETTEVKLPAHSAGFPAMIYHYSVPLDPAQSAGLAGHAPVKSHTATTGCDTIALTYKTPFPYL